jgi:hypothetical protein
MKAIPCKIIVNNRWGYCYGPQSFPSVRQAYEYGKGFLGGFAFRIFNLVTGELIKSGYCDAEF